MVVYSIAFVRLLRNSDFTVSELSVEADMVVLYPAVIPAPNAIGISQMLEVTRDRLRFMEELHGRLHAPQSKIKGIYLPVSHVTAALCLLSPPPPVYREMRLRVHPENWLDGDFPFRHL